MLQYLLIGASYALAAGLQPGPLQTFFLAKVVEQREHYDKIQYT